MFFGKLATCRYVESQHFLQCLCAANDLLCQIFGYFISAFILETISHIVRIRQYAPDLHSYTQGVRQTLKYDVAVSRPITKSRSAVKENE